MVLDIKNLWGCWREKNYLNYKVYFSFMPQSQCIRTATFDDFERIVELERLCFQREHAYSRRQLRYLLTKAHSMVLVETLDNVIRGFVIVLFRRGTAVAGIETINVDPVFRKMGIGLRLLSAVEDHLRKDGIRTIRLEVAITNAAAIALYEHAGYHQVMLLKKYYHFTHQGSRDAYRMIKRLG
jgi:ribosomal protein S18 acetylase RimI-like enzyme